MKVVSKKISEIFQDPSNERSHPEKNMDALKGSLTKYGQQKPIVVDEKGIILAGNGTYAAAKSLGWEKIDVVISDLKGLDKAGYRIADNRTSELAEWDTDALEETLKALAEEDYGLSDIGFDIEDYDFGNSEKEGLTDQDEVPEISENFFNVKRGDIWELGNHRLMCGDSTSKNDIDRLMIGENAEFCFTSPPYSDQRDYNGELELNPKHLAKFFDAPCKLFAVNLGIKRKDNEIFPYWNDYINSAKEYCYKFLSWNIWDRSGLGGSIGNQTAIFPIWHEWIFIFGEKKELNKTKKNKTEGSKRGYNRQKDGSTIKGKGITSKYGKIGTVIKTGIADGKLHPAMFPVELPEEYIKACSNKSDIIYEPFLGSGSTLIACEKTNRKCFGMEIDPHYCSIIIKRWQDFAGQNAIKIS